MHQLLWFLSPQLSSHEDLLKDSDVAVRIRPEKNKCLDVNVCIHLPIFIVEFWLTIQDFTLVYKFIFFLKKGIYGCVLRTTVYYDNIN